MADLNGSLPISAAMSNELRAMLRGQLPDLASNAECRVTRVDYAGDEGGIMCKLELAVAGSLADRGLFVSITHLRFVGRSPLVRDVAAYQKHRSKKIRRAMGAGWGSMVMSPTHGSSE